MKAALWGRMWYTGLEKMGPQGIRMSIIILALGARQKGPAVVYGNPHVEFKVWGEGFRV